MPIRVEVNVYFLWTPVTAVHVTTRHLHSVGRRLDVQLTRQMNKTKCLVLFIDTLNHLYFIENILFQKKKSKKKLHGMAIALQLRKKKLCSLAVKSKSCPQYSSHCSMVDEAVGTSDFLTGNYEAMFEPMPATRHSYELGTSQRTRKNLTQMRKHKSLDSRFELEISLSTSSSSISEGSSPASPCFTSRHPRDSYEEHTRRKSMDFSKMGELGTSECKIKLCRKKSASWGHDGFSPPSFHTESADSSLEQLDCVSPATSLEDRISRRLSRGRTFVEENELGDTSLDILAAACSDIENNHLTPAPSRWQPNFLSTRMESMTRKIDSIVVFSF